MQGAVSLHELEEALGQSFGRDDVATVGGLILALFGRVPKPGESLESGAFRIVVEQMARRRVQRVHFERLHVTEDDDQDVAVGEEA